MRTETSHRRLTLIARDSRKPDMDWNYRPAIGDAIAFIDSPAAIRAALDAGTDLGLDIGRVIVDRSGEPDDFLKLLTALPVEFAGDALYIRDDGSAFMSATGRGGDRVLYSLNAHDVRFYLETLNLVTGRVVMERTA
jgi:hypothetical protein